MNSLEIKAAFPDVLGKRIANVVELKEQAASSSRERRESTDIYRTDTASDSVVAKVLSFSIGHRFDSTLSADSTRSPASANKLQVIDGGNVFDIGKVVDNVLSFVTTALTELAKNGATKVDISYFKQQAAEGVNLGVDQAKSELANISDERLTKSIDDSRTKILDGINVLSDDPAEYGRDRSDNANYELNEFVVTTKSGKPVDISFGSKAFLLEANEQGKKQLFTSQTSNLSFSISGSLLSDEIIAFADVVNQADDLANTFYRKDIEALYGKAIAIGYDDADLLNLSSQNGARANMNMINAYQDIQHLTENSKLESSSSPKAVAEYVTRLMSVMDTSERELASVEDYNQVINGLVNQMKDVQVPDLLQAINRFHAFNTKFVNLDESVNR